MIVTLILSLILMASLFLMIWVAVSLVQSKKLFTTAPKDIQAAALKHKERFPGARALGWFLLLLCAALFLHRFMNELCARIGRSTNICMTVFQKS